MTLAPEDSREHHDPMVLHLTEQTDPLRDEAGTRERGPQQAIALYIGGEAQPRPKL